MSLSINDIFLATGTAVALGAAGVLCRVGLGSDAFKTVSSIGLMEGVLIAFLSAIIAVGIDVQSSVNLRLGVKANTFILRRWQGWFSLLTWGAFNAAMFQVVVLNPNWAAQTFGFKVGDNLQWTGLTVGVSAMLLIRSKLMKINNVELGFEWIYLWTSAQVLNAVNLHRIKIKRRWEEKFKPSVEDIAGHPSFFSDLEAYFKDVSQGSPEKTQAAVLQEFQRLRTNYVPSGAADPDSAINVSVPARRYAVSAVLDHLGQTELLAWAKNKGIAI